jgi:hypothetical protein
MFVRLGLSIAALLALSAGAAQAGDCPSRKPRPVVHVVHRPARDCGCHRVRHVVYRRRDGNEGVGYTGPEPAREASYQYSESETDRWSSREFDQGLALGAPGDVHLSDTDQYGYLTWPGKHRFRDYVMRGGGCPSACVPPAEAYVQNTYPGDVYHRGSYYAPARSYGPPPPAYRDQRSYAEGGYDARAPEPQPDGPSPQLYDPRFEDQGADMPSDDEGRRGYPDADQRMTGGDRYSAAGDQR